MSEKIPDEAFDPENILLNYEVSRTLSKALTIARLLLSEEIEPIHVFLALALSDKCLLHQYFEFISEAFDPIDCLNYIVNDKELFEKITEKSYDVFLKATCQDVEFINNVLSEDNSSSSNTTKNSTSFIIPENNTSNSVKEDSSVATELSAIVEETFGIYIEDFYDINYSKEFLHILDTTFIYCSSNNQNYIDADNLLYQIISSNKCKKLLAFAEEFDIDLKNISQYLSYAPTIFTNAQYNLSAKKISIPKALKNCCKILTNFYKKDTVCDVLGRDKELAKLWNTFSKKTKKNCILVGDPGVGKTAIIEALVLSIINNTCPAKFADYSVIELNITGMTAGTKYRGELEEKLMAFIKFVENTPNIIIFIDEIHNIIGTGSTTESAMDIGGALKPILSRDSIIVVGATTTEEYSRFFNKEGALKRRFETIYVSEPSFSQIKPMIKKRVTTLSNFHKVSVSDTVLDFVIKMAFVFNSTTANPDKTIDLLDKSLAYASNCGAKKLLKSHVSALFEDNFDEYNKNSFEYNKSIAYHEAGHYILLMHYKEILRKDVILVSIIPNDSAAGITCFENMEGHSIDATLEYYKALVSVDLAGRIAQKMYTNTINSGASADLVSANVLVEQIIAEFGMDSEYENIILPYSINNSDSILSEYTLNEILKKKTKLLNDIYKETETILYAYEDTLNKIVKLLLHKKIVNADELEKIFNS